MRKVGRNESCPCGSGKKYKKCHGASNVIQITPEPYNDKLDELHYRLIDYAISNFILELHEIYDLYPQDELMEEEYLLNMYLSALTSWAILHEPVRGEETIFDIYYKKEQGKIKHERVREVFESWRELLPSVYEVLIVTEDVIYVKDIQTEVEYPVSRPEEPSEFEEGNLLAGFLLPFVEEYRFMFSLLEVPHVSEDTLEVVQIYLEADVISNYPYIIADLLVEEVDDTDIDWKSPQYKEVADLFTMHALEKEASKELISVGLLLWLTYMDELNPDILKPAGYAAALEYVIQKHLIGSAFQSQKDLASEYGVSVTTVSKHSRNMAEVLRDEINELVSEVEQAEKGEVIHLSHRKK